MREKPEIINFDEVIQAGDVFLMKFKCPLCDAEVLTDAKNAYCINCKSDFKECVFTTDKKRFHRLIAGTQRKPGLVTKKLVRSLRAIQDNKCAYCWCNLHNKDFHVDHIVPIGFGGTNNIDNLALACPRCNLTAGGLVFSTLYAKQTYILRKRKDFQC